MLKGKHILIGVSGGIAIYKVLEVISRLNKAGATSEVIMTEAAEAFVAPLTFETMSRNKVHRAMFHPQTPHEEVSHIALTERADVFLVAPATANIMAKAAHGLADDMLSATILAAECPVIFAPTMNTRMFHHPATQNNIQTLASYGHGILQPNSGELACNASGDGRMAEPWEIVDALDAFLTEKDLMGKRIIVTAGPTVERIDPVRYITNDSSGKMGYAIAERARKRGAQVVLISGPVAIPAPQGVDVVSVQSTQDMFQALEDHFEPADVVIMAAAPADYKPETTSDQKIKKTGSDRAIQLAENPDIIGHFGKIKGDRVLIGFSAETENLLDNARGKLARKNLDFIVANDVTQEGAGFNIDTNIATIIGKDYEVSHPLMEKSALADHILDLLL